MIGILNYGMGNLQSVKNALDYLKVSNAIVGNIEDINACSKIILPGVGAFGEAMARLESFRFCKEIKKFVDTGKPVLGICLGMQLLFEKSCELGDHKGLALLKGTVKSLKDQGFQYSIPHIGWNDIYIQKKDSRIAHNIDDDATFYFVHSYYCDPVDLNMIVSKTDYGLTFASIVESGNVYGCQFHPEKSQYFGLKILENFVKIC